MEWDRQQMLLEAMFDRLSHEARKELAKALLFILPTLNEDESQEVALILGTTPAFLASTIRSGVEGLEEPRTVDELEDEAEAGVIRCLEPLPVESRLTILASVIAAPESNIQEADIREEIGHAYAYYRQEGAKD